MRKVKLYQSGNHHGNFRACVKIAQPTITPDGDGAFILDAGPIGSISMMVGRKIKGNAGTEKI